MKRSPIIPCLLIVFGLVYSCTSRKSDEPFAYHYLDGKTVISETHIRNVKGEIDTVYTPMQREDGKQYNCVDTMSNTHKIGYEVNH